MEDAAVYDPLEGHYFTPDEPEVVGGKPIEAIDKCWVDDYPSIVDRFFTRYYYVKAGVEPAPYKVLFHSNRVCLICLSPDHPAMQAELKSVDFAIGNADRSKNVVRGKAKRGGMCLQPETSLAMLTTTEGKTYKVPSCVKGKLIEVNTGLIANPKSLITAVEGNNYLAIILLKPEQSNDIKESLLTPAQYEELKERNFQKEGEEPPTEDTVSDEPELEPLDDLNSLMVDDSTMFDVIED